MSGWDGGPHQSLSKPWDWAMSRFRSTPGLQSVPVSGITSGIRLIAQVEWDEVGEGPTAGASPVQEGPEVVRLWGLQP